MQLILLEKVQNLGDLGDQVNVKPGYGRNYLVPQRMAVSATPENMAKFEAQRAEFEKAALIKMNSAEGRVGLLAGVELTLAANASEEGKLYGSIGPREISDGLAAAGHEVSKSEVTMSEGPIRHTGEHEVLIQLHADVETHIKVIVNPE